MPDSSTQTTQTPTYLANYADCGAMINQAKIASYMWYIHVTVRVNAADRLRHSLAYILGQATTTTTPLSTSYSAPFGFTHINIAGSGNTGSRTLVNECEVASETDRIDDLVDYFVLGHFYQGMLEILVNTAPIEEYARGYEQALAAIPAHFREEFCRRLYGLLFSKYIVEWPQGIAVPEPAPGSIAAVATAATTSTESETVAASTSSGTSVSERSRSPTQTPVEDDDDKGDWYKTCMDRIISHMDVLLSDDEAEEDYFTCNNSVVGGEKYKYLANTEPKSPGDQSTLGPATPWPDTPSLGYNPELAKAAYFGTVSEPQPIQYRGIWGRRRSNSSRDDGTARGACEKAKTGAEGGTGEYACAAADADAASAASEDASHDDPRLPSASNSPRHQQQQHLHQQHHTPRPPHDATPQDRPASLLGSAHSRRVSHTGSCCCSCRARQAWSHGVGAQR